MSSSNEESVEYSPVDDDEEEEDEEEEEGELENDDPMTEALEMLSQTSPEEIEAISQMDEEEKAGEEKEVVPKKKPFFPNNLPRMKTEKKKQAPAADVPDDATTVVSNRAAASSSSPKNTDDSPKAESPSSASGGSGYKAVPSPSPPSSPTSMPVSEPVLPFLKQMYATVQQQREVFFAIYFHYNNRSTYEVTFGELWDASGVIAWHLKNKWKVSRGGRVVLCYDFGPLSLFAVLGCWRAGVVPILVDAPPLPYQSDKIIPKLARLNHVARQCQPLSLVLTSKPILQARHSDMTNLFSASRNMWLSQVEWRDTESLSKNPPLLFLRPGDKPPPHRPYYTYDEGNLTGTDIALIQYTSGTTGDPQPVMISHASLQAQLDMAQRMIVTTAFTDDDGYQTVAQVSGLSHLSPTDPWGLIHAAVLPLMRGWRMYYMSSQECDINPLVWLERISQHKVTWSVVPDALLPRLVEAFLEARTANNGVCPIPHLNLSSLQHVHIMGQPLKATYPEEMHMYFAEFGLRDQWYMASYGLAEHVAGTLFLPREFQTHQYESLRYETTRRVAVASRSTMDEQLLVKIVDPETKTEVPDGTVGELWISSPAIAMGYFGDAQLTESRMGVTLEGSTAAYLRSGDAAFFQEDYLYVCGPLDDAMTLKQHTGDGSSRLSLATASNQETAVYQPKDIEWIVERASPDVCRGSVAAFATKDDDLVIVFEIFQNHRSEPPQVCQTIRSTLTAAMGVKPLRVVAIREQNIPKTWNGKVRRKATKRQLSNKHLDILFDSMEQQDILSEQKTEEIMQSFLLIDKIFERYFGVDFDPKATWEDLGLSSLSSIDLRYDIANHAQVHLPSNYCDKYPNPEALKDFVLQSSGKPFPKRLPYLPIVKTKGMGWMLQGILQALCSVLILILFSASAIPAWYYFDVLMAYHLQLAVIPIFMATYSVIVLLCKWILIVRYRKKLVKVPSIPYVRWWMIDRMVGMWEFWVGRFFLNTPLLNIYYKLLGARVAMSAQLNGFIREFDLITIGSHAILDHKCTKARKFVSWNRSEAGPSLVLRPIKIGPKSLVRGMLCPGVRIGRECVVEKLSVLPEGAQVPDQCLVSGNPAIAVGKAPSLRYNNGWIMGLLKLLWLVSEFAIYSAIIFLASDTAYLLLPRVMFDTWLVWWAVFVPLFSMTSLVSSIVIKWVLLGRRKPGKYAQGLAAEMAEWAADMHFFLATIIFQTFSLNSRFCNFILRGHGMDIDLASKVYFDSFPPSKLDLIHIRTSLVAEVSFDVKKYGAFYPTFVSNSNLGQGSHIAAGVSIQNTVVPPVSHVVERSILNDTATLQLKLPFFSMRQEFIITILYLVVIVSFKMTVYAGYLYWCYFEPYVPSWAIMFYLAGAFAIQSTLWLLLILLLQTITYMGLKDDNPIPWSTSLYEVYLSSMNAFQNWSALPILWGSPLLNDILRLLGASIEGRMLFFGDHAYDGPLQTVANRTVMDGAYWGGHNIVHEDIRVGACRVAGLIREGCVIVAHAEIGSKTSGPYRPIIQHELRSGSTRLSTATTKQFLNASQRLDAPETHMV